MNNEVGAAKVCVLYLGRHGAGPELTRLLTRALRDLQVRTLVVVSDRSTGVVTSSPLVQVELIPTYDNIAQLILAIARIPFTALRIRNLLRRNSPQRVICVMGTPLSILLLPLIRRRGTKTASIVHDARRHPGDKFHRLTHLLLRLEIFASDRVITLSKHVEDQIYEHYNCSPSKVLRLFHPNYEYLSRPPRNHPRNSPFRFAFLGRISKYKGLNLLLDAFEILFARNRNVELLIAGSGELSDVAIRDDLPVRIINRYLSDVDIEETLNWAHCIVLPYIEASQSGIASASFSAALPVVYTPVKGLSEQLDGCGALCAESISSSALAEAMGLLATDVALYESLSRKQSEIAPKLSWRSFAERLLCA